LAKRQPSLIAVPHLNVCATEGFLVAYSLLP